MARASHVKNGLLTVTRECVDRKTKNKIDLSSDGWVSVNDILMEEGHAYEYDGGKKKVFNG